MPLTRPGERSSLGLALMEDGQGLGSLPLQRAPLDAIAHMVATALRIGILDLTFIIAGHTAHAHI